MSRYSAKLRLADICKSKSRNKLLKRAFGVALFGSNFLIIDQTNLKFDFRSLISRLLTIFKCILAPLCANQYFQAMFTVPFAMLIKYKSYIATCNT